MFVGKIMYKGTCLVVKCMGLAKTLLSDYETNRRRSQLARQLPLREI